MVNAAKKGFYRCTKGKECVVSIHSQQLFYAPGFVCDGEQSFSKHFWQSIPMGVLAAITIGSAGIKHWLNLREQGKLSVWIMPVSVIILLAACLCNRAENV
jgi:hypothetical protein